MDSSSGGRTRRPGVEHHLRPVEIALPCGEAGDAAVLGGTRAADPEGCLWFDTQVEEAARYYTEIFTNSRIGTITRHGEAGREVHEQPLKRAFDG